MATDTPQRMENQLRKMLYEQKPRKPIYDVTKPARSETPLSKDSSPPPLPQIVDFDLNYKTMVRICVFSASLFC